MTDVNGYDVVVVGGGISGLTGAAYLTSYGYHVLLLEKESSLGGNISSFSYKGHIIDGGIRSIENAGVLKPMIRDLGLDVELLKSPVTLGIEHQVINLNSIDDLINYERLLIDLFPQDERDIKRILRQIRRILKYMDVLYGIDNPMMIDLKKNKSYVFKTLVPWLFKFVPTLYHIDRLHEPVEKFLLRYTTNPSLIDMIAQHFFKATPTFFALGYFSIYFDYHYPKGGTSVLIDALEQHIIKNRGVIFKNTQVAHVDAANRVVTDTHDVSYGYKKLIWAADLKALYHQLELPYEIKQSTLKRIYKQKNSLIGKKGAESVLTVYATVKLPPSYFKDIASGHFFYTPKKTGISKIDIDVFDDHETLFKQLRMLYDNNTYEISIPSLRDKSLSPDDETALIISILINYELVKHIADNGFYEQFKSFTESYFIDVLSDSIYKDLKTHIIDTFSSTPLTFKKRTGSTDGAIIGWAYDNHPIPVHHKMSKITKAIYTPIPNVYQAGQWSFSPAGVPVSILTGKLSADRIRKELKSLHNNL